MLPTVAASAHAADDLGYHGMAQLIRNQRLGPQAIARLFAHAMAKDRVQACAVVLIAGAIAHYNVNRDGFSFDLERELAVGAVGVEGMEKANREAVQIVSKHWAKIKSA